MATPIFNATTGTPLVFQAGKAIVTVKNSGKAVFTDIEISFSRQMQQIPTLGDKIVYSAQRPQGTIRASAILTNDSRLITAFGAGADACNPIEMRVEFQDSECSKTNQTLVLHGVLCSSVTFSISGQNGYIADSFDAVFSRLDVSRLDV